MKRVMSLDFVIIFMYATEKSSTRTKIEFKISHITINTDINVDIRILTMTQSYEFLGNISGNSSAT